MKFRLEIWSARTWGRLVDEPHELVEPMEMPKYNWVVYKMMYRGFSPHRKHSNRINKIKANVEMIENNPNIIWQTINNRYESINAKR
jgi:hypothetical protein